VQKATKMTISRFQLSSYKMNPIKVLWLSSLEMMDLFLAILINPPLLLI